MKQIIYLDNSATTKPAPSVVQAMMQCLENTYGNPSSVHRLGVEAEKIISQARNEVADILKVKPKEIVFTSGGSESNNLAIKGAAYSLSNRGKHIITTEIEHPAVLNVCRQLEEEGFKITYLPPDNEGVIRTRDFQDALQEDTVLVSTMYVNNETGAIQPLEEIAKVIKRARSGKKTPVWHVDAVQALGKVPLYPKKLGIDLLSLSAHKVHGPKGVGALFVAEGTPLKPQIAGGGQEMGLRSGTENVPAIAGFGAAVSRLKKEAARNSEHMAALKKMLVEGVLKNIPDTRLNGPPVGSNSSAPHIANISFIGVRGEVLLHYLEQQGIYTSTGSACSSRKTEEQRVLKSMGLSAKEMDGALRFSFCAENTAEEVKIVLNKLQECVKELRSFG
ncbi:cysteine desulfurase [Desulfohalotomaculum tongense]|uniref:cysteine desulfurase family protein n=1 Tax=Desulforadius tongensis TaxID=1216062 RepID=UPI0019560190|nr:cysteine desulfurase family protein [Desulforadius tongensis]MBM7854814.1 cysteine desulfurase [Desulforadius tongensis]